MADGFDIVDIVYAATESAKTGLIGYKDGSATGETNNHYTVRATGVEIKSAVNKAPVVNVNVFVKKYDNGMSNRQVMKTVCRALAKAINENIVIPKGMYWKSRIVWSEPMGEAKQGFDCMNIRLEVITELK